MGNYNLILEHLAYNYMYRSIVEEAQSKSIKALRPPGYRRQTYHGRHRAMVHAAMVHGAGVAIMGTNLSYTSIWRIAIYKIPYHSIPHASGW